MTYLEDAKLAVEEHGQNAVRHLKDQIFSALDVHDEAKALHLDAVLRLVEKILGIDGLDDFPGALH